MRVLAFFACLLGASATEAGPWGRSKGGLYVNVAYEALGTTSLATPEGVIQTIPAYDLHQIGVYAAYGLSNRTTFVLDRLGFRRSSIEGFESASGLEDLRAGFQQHLGSVGPWLFAARGILQAPTGDETKGLGVLPTGSGAWEGDLRLSVGRSSPKGRLYGYAEIGHQVRGNGLRDGLVYEAQIGLWASRRSLLQLNVRGIKPYSSEPGEAAFTSPAGLGDGVTYTAVGPAIVFELGRGFGLQLEAEDAFHAKNLATGVKVRIKVFYSR